LPLFRSLWVIFLFNIATVSPLTLHIIDRARNLMKFKNKSRYFRLDFSIQRQDLWALKFTWARYDNNSNILVFYDIFLPKRLIYFDSNIEILIAFSYSRCNTVILPCLWGNQGLLLWKALFKVIQKVVELRHSRSLK
jgi:hypothetical protein